MAPATAARATSVAPIEKDDPRALAAALTNALLLLLWVGNGCPSAVSLSVTMLSVEVGLSPDASETDDDDETVTDGVVIEGIETV